MHDADARISKRECPKRGIIFQKTPAMLVPCHTIPSCPCRLTRNPSTRPKRVDTQQDSTATPPPNPIAASATSTAATRNHTPRRSKIRTDFLLQPYTSLLEISLHSLLHLGSLRAVVRGISAQTRGASRRTKGVGRRTESLRSGAENVGAGL